MPIYNNPALDQAFQNIAGMFAPPSGSDAAGYAVAAAKKAEAARIADLDAYAQSPDFNPEVFDRRGVIADLYDPTQSFRAVDMDDATKRYGYDTQAKTSLATNEADNATSRANNAATVAGGVQQQRIQGLAGLYGPLNPGQIRPDLPAEAASQFGMSGAIGAAVGTPKPLSETEWQAGQNERLRQSGQLSDDDLRDAILGEHSPVEAIGPGGRTTFMSPGAAVRTGAQPAQRSPMVSVNTGEQADGKLRGKLDETEGKRLSDLQATAVTSSGLRQDLDLLGELIDYAPQGPLVGRLAGLFPGASDAGAAFQSIVERAAPGLRVEGSGATSDIEFRGMLNSLPQLRNRPEANRLIAAMMQAKADINIRRGELVTAYQNEEISASQMRQSLAELNRQSIASPGLKAMIDEVGGGVEPMANGGADAPAPSPGTIVDGHRFKGGDPSDPANWELL